MDHRNPSRQWCQKVALSWQALSELARRHPQGAIFQEWPCSGYDELMFVDRAGPGHVLIGLDRDGPVHADPGPTATGTGTDWWRLSVSGGRASAVRFEKVAHLRPPSTTPKTTPKTLTYRVLSAICNQSLLTDVFLDPRPGYTVYDGWESTEDRYFKLFPAAAALMTPRAEPFDDRIGVHPPHHFWFLIPYKMPGDDIARELMSVVPDADPVVALSTAGMLWTSSGRSFDVVAGYQRHHREFLPLVMEIFDLFTSDNMAGYQYGS